MIKYMLKEFSQLNMPVEEPKLEDFFVIRGGTLNLKGVFQTENFIEGKRGVRIQNEGLNASNAVISGESSTIITGSLEHTGSAAGFFGTTPAARPTVTFGNTNGEISGLTFSAGYVAGEVEALRDKCEELADDARNLRAALATLGLII